MKSFFGVFSFLAAKKLDFWIPTPAWSPVDRHSNPSPGYLQDTVCRGYRVGGFLHPSFYGVPGEHTELLKPSMKNFYLPMDVFSSEGVIVCRSWAAAKCRALVSSYFGRGGTSNVIGQDDLRNLLSQTSTRRPAECPKPALVPYLSMLYNDNRGTVDWTKGCSVSRKLRHVNMRELSVRLHQRLGNIDVQHIAGKRNIADILTKEERDDSHFRAMAFTITTPRLLVNWDPDTGDTIDDNGDIERPTPKSLPSTTLPPKPIEVDDIPTITVTATAARGVLESACGAHYSINGWLSGYDPRAGLCAGMA